MNRRELIVRTPLVLAAASLDITSLGIESVFAQTAPPLAHPLNQTLLNSLSANLGPIITKIVNGTGTGADVVRIRSQISSLRTELTRVNVEPTFKFACTKFSGSDPRFTSSAVATAVLQVTRQWAPSVTYAEVHTTYLRMPQYNPALPPIKLVGIMQGSLNQLASQGLEGFLLQVESVLQQIGSFIYGNFFLPTTCQQILRDLFFLSAALTVISGICLFTGVLVAICGLARIIAFVVAVIGALLRALVCGI